MFTRARMGAVAEAWDTHGCLFLSGFILCLPLSFKATASDASQGPEGAITD